MRHREEKWLPLGHTASTWWSQDLNPGTGAWLFYYKVIPIQFPSPEILLKVLWQHIQEKDHRELKLKDCCAEGVAQR